ncbi:MAG: hypothetical protein A2X49_09685 [Lentisphaerae bacterium GWF2_52_8]|nr:MAG: hypothetical protein A2X49_09685 [Lentisphaerae bacterium GWF2_52_8]
MPKKTSDIRTVEDARLSIERAFLVFQEQSEALEQVHEDLRNELHEVQTDLAAKNEELALRIAEIEAIRERLSGILESIGDAVFLLGTDGSLSAANAAAESLEKSIPGGADSLLRTSSLSALLRKGKSVRDELIDLNIDNEKLYYLASAVPMSGAADQTHCQVLCLKDITVQRKLQERLAREDRMAALGHVAASVAHEIRNPLGALEGFAALLGRDLREEPQKKRLADKIVQASRQLNAVVGNLLSYTREMKPSASPQNLNSLILEALEFMQPLADDRQVELRAQVSKRPVIASVDPVQFKQVIGNLVSNALDACPRRAGGFVTVCSSSSGKMALVEVSDNGPGIPASKKKQIFEPFFTMKDGGIGLGLSLCQRIAESHDGTIHECGEEGKGAHFVLKLKKAEGKDD